PRRHTLPSASAVSSTSSSSATSSHSTWLFRTKGAVWPRATTTHWPSGVRQSASPVSRRKVSRAAALDRVGGLLIAAMLPPQGKGPRARAEGAGGGPTPGLREGAGASDGLRRSGGRLGVAPDL